jgi:hypothetical protein
MKRYPEPGARIYVKGMGKHAVGTVVATNAPISARSYRERGLVSYRCDWNKGEHLVPLANCRLLKPKIYKNESQFDKEGQEK